MSRSRAGDKGFTLIELLVVILILATLAAVVVFAVGSSTDKGQNAACKADRKAIVIAEEAYFTQPVSAGGGGGKYGDEAQLVPKFLTESSTMHDVIAVSGGDGYDISGVSPCP